MEVVVIGGSVAGLKAACRISRLQPDARVRVLVKDRKFGYSASGLPYYLSGDVDSYAALVSTPNGTLKDERYFREVKGVEVLTRHEVTAIDRAARIVRCRMLDADCEVAFPYDKLVLATGSQPVLPAIPGADTPGVRLFVHPEDAIQLRDDLEHGRIEKVAIIGAGIVGLELCEAFRSMWGVEVDLIELQPRVLSGLLDTELARLVEDELQSRGINLLLGCGCREIIADEDKICVFDNSGDMLQADRIILATGVRPNSDLARAAGLEIGITGGIKVDEHLATSDPDIFAAGDCVELPNAVDGQGQYWSLGSLAVRMGRVVGDNICNGDSRVSPVAGAMVLKLFDLTIGLTGLTVVECEEKGYETGRSWGTFHDRMNYYPEAVPLHAHLLYDLGSGRVLGFQAVSRGHLIHILDVASQVIHSGATIDELHEIEHVYSPPYAQPFSPLHYLAFIAENSHSAGVRLVPPDEFDTLTVDTLILDVRSPHEIAGRHLEVGKRAKIEIPIEELRSRLNEVPRGVEVVAVCQMGGRSWDAALLLRRAGWDKVGILAGGALFQPLKADLVSTSLSGRR